MKKFLLCITTLLLATTLWTNTSEATTKSTVVANSAETTLSANHAPNSYRMIYDAMLVGNETGQFDTSEVSYQRIGDLIQQVTQENPEIMYYKGATFWSNGKIEFRYSKDPAIIKTSQQQLQKKADEVLNAIIKPHFTDFDKVKAIHDYLALHTAYDYENLLSNQVPADSYTAYGALLNQVAVCDGYTKAAQLLLNRLGIANSYVYGRGDGQDHSWNMIKLDGQPYFMDITWDDPVPNQEGRVRYSYFLVTSDQLRKDHSWVESNWPVATSTTYAYFQDFKKMQEVGNYYYYSSNQDNAKLYRIQKDGTGKQKINDVRAPYFAITSDWIYFSNYSNGGYLYKMKTDGSSIQKLNERHSIDLRIESNMLHFKDEQTSSMKTLVIESSPTVTPIGQHVNSLKQWTVTFNTKIDPASITGAHFNVMNDQKEVIPVKLAIDSVDPRKVLISAPTGGYERNRNYTLTVQNAKSALGKVQTKAHVKEFYVE
ncbi:DUF5050 domain-containing protein [Sporosarcina obsidiansis]|uniref:DUF5050 domain-containing protein n=1 Tax=Sporosarcina obsidiansis TaxID=2660748 RepID=UPI00129B2459|nr:DUF5050 domain-containing protein [Sporosarcina obsidiansis]